MNKDELRELALKQIEGTVFTKMRINTNKSFEDDDFKEDNHLMFENLLMKQVKENFEKLKEKCN